MLDAFYCNLKNEAFKLGTLLSRRNAYKADYCTDYEHRIQEHSAKCRQSTVSGVSISRVRITIKIVALFRTRPEAEIMVLLKCSRFFQIFYEHKPLIRLSEYWPRHVFETGGASVLKVSYQLSRVLPKSETAHQRNCVTTRNTLACPAYILAERGMSFSTT